MSKILYFFFMASSRKDPGLAGWVVVDTIFKLQLKPKLNKKEKNHMLFKCHLKHKPFTKIK